MAQMCTALRAPYLDAKHAVAEVFGLFDVGGHGALEARPAAAGIELVRGIEQLGTAATAVVMSRLPFVPVLAGKGRLGALLAGDAVLLRVEQLAPRCIRFLCFAGHGVFSFLIGA